MTFMEHRNTEGDFPNFENKNLIKIDEILLLLLPLESFKKN